ncbi:Enhancer of mRNA-decapping protein 4 [Acorus gramineus]|uniref:Enhancer of mRNA-decapping protein 4 n=1 Tax=Acorus gramineus TaxID=55184 RepID=A0AAV9AZZ3_ACOGR|nr:Enhancer of mRNA-decapping protein 4 [Acorus gramineus]
MASPGNPNSNPNPHFDMHKLFKPPQNPNLNPTSAASPSPYVSPPPTAAPPPGPFSYPPQTNSPFHHHQHQHYLPFPLYPPQPQPPLPNPNPNANNHGARLMALLGASDLPPTAPIATASSMPPSSSDFVPSAPPMAAPAGPARTPSNKIAKGRRMTGDRTVYDVNVRLPGEGQPPQLEVAPITKYVSDPGLVLGRQIAVNRSYICYGLKQGAIRVLNINTALRALLRGHSQRVTDMAFFAEDVHLLASASMDGRIFVWKIGEGPDEENKPQITGKIVVAIQIVGEGESYHPRICWHSHKQEILFVGIGNRVLKVDTIKVGRGEIMSAEQPLMCSIDRLIDGVQLVGKHDGEVIDLSISQWMITRLVSASTDGTVKVWDDRKTVPLSTLVPHDGQPGPLNREVKLWASAGQEGWLLPSDAESWHCTQTLDLRSSAEPRPEDSFFNQVVVLSRASLILLANAKKNAIYAIHVDYGPCPTSTRMDYISEFTVTMPILSLTGTSDCLPDGEHVVQVYCVQTQAIQQYALDLSQCLPPPQENVGLEKDSSMPHVFGAAASDTLGALEPSHETTVSEMPAGTHKPALSPSSVESSSGTRHPEFSVGSDVSSIPDLATSVIESKPSAPPLSMQDADGIRVSSPHPPSSSELSGKFSGLKSPTKGFDQGPTFTEHAANQPVLDYSVDRRVDAVTTNSPDVSFLNDTLGKDEARSVQNDISMVPNPPTFQLISNPKHLVTPSEILSVSAASSGTSIIEGPKEGEKRVQDVIVSNDMELVEVEVKVVGESSPIQKGASIEINSHKESSVLDEVKDRPFDSQNLEPLEMAKECTELTTEILSMDTQQVEEFAVIESQEQQSSTGDVEVEDAIRDASEKLTEADTVTPSPQLPSPASKGKKQQKTKASQASGPSSATPSPFNSTDSLNEPGSSGLGVPSAEVAFSQILSMQNMLNQLMTMQKEMQKQMTMLVAVPVNKEGRRVEASLGRSMEKSVKANVDALWARFQEDDAKHEKQERERVQQITTLISNCMNKDLPAMLERAIKKEISAIGPAVARAVAAILEKTISSAVAESFQRGVGDKAVNQLEKSVNSKLEATVARQIQAQFQTSGKQALQDALRSNLESSVIPAFEQSCKTMFEQVDAAFQKGITEHVNSAQQQFESAHSPLALALRDTINSASSFTQTLKGELAEGQRKLLAAAVASGGIPKALNPLAMQSNGPSGGLHEIGAPVDPTKELTRLISERKFEEAFTLALQRSDVSIVSWLCSQVDLKGICAMAPLPLSQGVLLSLLQQLACDISNDTGRKLGWMTDVAVAINPTDPTIALHVRRIFEQVYGIVRHQSTLPNIPTTEGSSLRVIMHIINSVLMSCK